MEIWKFYLIIIGFICNFFIKGIASEYTSYNGYNRETYQKPYNSDYSNVVPKYPHTYHQQDRENINLPAPSSKTEYGFHTVQTGTAYIPPGQKRSAAYTAPINDKKTQYYFVTTNTTTFYVPGKLNSRRTYENQTGTNIQDNRHHTRHRRRQLGTCIKCPTEKVMIAQKGLDGVLIEAPKLMSCQNRAIISDLYQIETLFGSSFKFLLPHGSHSFHARIRNKRTGKSLQNCILRYKVIVQQCGRYFPRDDNIKVNCDPGYIWGAKCNFACRLGYLSHDRPMICGDSLRWEGDEPECLSFPPSKSKSCDFLGIPDHGRFSCEYPKGINSESYENELTTPEGTICHVICDSYYEIPTYLSSHSVLRCENGKWNTTANNLCQTKNHFKYLL